jgi:hypothetical protein
MALVKTNLLQFGIDAKASLFTIQAFASGIVAVVAHRLNLRYAISPEALHFRRNRSRSRH